MRLHDCCVDGERRQAELDAALLLLARMGIPPADLLRGATPRPAAPAFAEYVPMVATVVSETSGRSYTSTWNGVLEHWGPAAHRRADHVGDLASRMTQ